ncbi:MAG: ribonuclease HII [Acidobacteriota bacterium]
MASKTMVQLFAEAYRLRLLCSLEEHLAQCGYPLVAGVDEAGRGALAGPVMAAAVIPDPACRIPGVDDSKQVGPAEREQLAEAIRSTAIAWSCVAVEAAVIDRINILEATRVAMRRSLEGLSPTPDIALIDAVSLADPPCPCLPVVRGDAMSYAIACASILAKTERDRRMVALGETYPHYGFPGHKGYGAQRHRDALQAYGPSPVHRLTFRSVLPQRAAAGGVS